MSFYDKYIQIRKRLNYSEVDFGSFSLYLFNEDEIERGQIGYSIDNCGNLLTGHGEGDWRDNWLVIGYDTLIGDPIFVDTNTSDLIVYTAPHGEGDWSERVISSSVEKFFKSLDVIRRISNDIDAPYDMENNPLSEEEKTSVINELILINGDIKKTRFGNHG